MTQPADQRNVLNISITSDHLKIDCAKEVERISEFIRTTLVKDLHRRGVIIGLSGGIDSSVTAALCVRAIGKERVFGLLMPERHSSSDTSPFGKIAAESLGITYTEHAISSILESAGCYLRQDEAIQSVIPEYQPGYPFKITLPLISGNDSYRIFSLTVQFPDGSLRKERMSIEAYLQMVAATNYKQRARKMVEYYYADKMNYAVAGSPNRLEYDQGFFVKNGDGSADFKPIAHLYKSQVYMLAEYLGIPEVIRHRPPTTDTYPMEQTQEEFYFSLPYDKMDYCLFAKNSDLPPESACKVTGLTKDQVAFVFDDIMTKRKTTRYQHLKPLTVDEIQGVG